MAIPSGYTALDFVGFTDKGTYANNITYVKNDLVHYGGDIWECLVDNTIGVTPSEGVNWTLWIGAPTNLVERIIAPLETNPATVAYAIGRQMIYDDWLWEVIVPIAIGDTLVDYAVDPTNANIKKAPAVETQLLSLSSKAYQTDDSTETDIADDDLLPFYDTSATARKKSTWSNIIEKIKAKLGTAATKDFTTSVTSGSSDLVTSGAVSSALTAKVNKTDVIASSLIFEGTATTQVPKGTYFYNNGVLSEATSTIYNGNTITNSNSKSVTIGDELSILDKKTSHVHSQSISNSHNISDWGQYKYGMLVGFMNGVGGFVGTLYGTTFTSISDVDISSHLTISLNGTILTIVTDGVYTVSFTLIRGE